MSGKGMRGKSKKELGKEIQVRQERPLTLRCQKATGQATSFGRMKEIRKTIARIKTVLTERENALSGQN